MPTDAFDMAIVHRVFRSELHNAHGLVRDVQAGDTQRSAIVGAHLEFILAALHHHHAAEDELIWPKLHARAPTHAVDITRMEDAHRGIGEADAKVRDTVASWALSADPRLADQLVDSVEEMSARVDEHLADEERNVVPLINDHIAPEEWQEAVGRAAEFMSRKNLRLGLVLGGYILDAASADEARRILANVPLPQRTLIRLFAKRTFASYRSKLNGASG
jgi:iron-sulfur cluster repair protein YtfE (RIC family)